MLEPQVKLQPAVISFNFNKYKTELEKRIAEYDIVVTDSNVAEAKKLATELNKLSGAIKSGFKVHIDELKQPAVKLDEHSKTLQSICQDGRQRILAQVDKFEQKKLDECSVLLVEFRGELWREYKVTDEFKKADHSDLVKLTSLTASGSLAKSARDALEARVKSDQALQNQTKMRLAELESRSYKAGLAAPLSRDHVESFLFADDDTYEQRLNAMFEREQEREVIAKKRYEEQQKPVEHTPELVDEPEIEEDDEPSMANREPIVHGDSVLYVFNARYEVRVPASVTAEKAKAHLLMKLIQLGIKPERIDQC